LPSTATYQQCLETLVFKKLHRVYITDATNRPQGLVTLTDMLAAVA
jgi:predicted transcriptional regulator